MIWTIIQLVISGIAMGFVYALIGIEYTLIYNASGVLNFSHDKMVSLGAYIYAGMFVLGLGWNSVVSAIASLLLMAVFGILVAYLIFIPLRKQKSMIFTIMATIMFGKVIMEGACLIWGGNAFTIPDFMSGTYQIGNAVISKSNLFLIIAAIVIVALLQFYLQKTKPGKAMRCVAQNRTAASIVGIDVNHRHQYRDLLLHRHPGCAAVQCQLHHVQYDRPEGLCSGRSGRLRLHARLYRGRPCARHRREYRLHDPAVGL